MNLFEKIIQEMAEYKADDEYIKHSDELVAKQLATKKYANEYEVLKSSRKHLKLDYKTKKTLEKSISELKIKDQIDVYKTINELLKVHNKQMFKALGSLLAEYIKEYESKNKNYDEELYLELRDSELLSIESKKELDAAQEVIISRSQKVKSKLSDDDVKTLFQQKLYKLLFADQQGTLDGKVRLGIIFKKYLDKSTSRMTLIDKYLLHRLIDLIYSGLTEEEIEEE